MFTVLIFNEGLQKARFCGRFDTLDEAQAYADKEAQRTRKFCTYEVYKGTPDNPRDKIEGSLRRGIH